MIPATASFQSTLRKQIMAILVNPYLRTRVYIDLTSSALTFNSQASLHLSINILNTFQSSLSPQNHSVSLKILLLDPYPENQPTFLFSNGDQSTYRELQVSSKRLLSSEYRLNNCVEDIVKCIDEGEIDIFFLMIDKTNTNLCEQVRNKNQGFNMSRNSSFKFPKKSNHEQKTRNESTSNGQVRIMSSFKAARKCHPMKKNANLPKFLIRIFIKYVDKFKKIYNKREFERLNIECKKMKEWKKNENKQQALGLKHLKMLFQQFKEGFPDPKVNRYIATEIINKYLLEEICQNSQIPQIHRLGYLAACRVYALRCRNEVLAGRIQSK